MAYAISRVVWFGIDFTAARFLYVPESPDEIVNQYLNAINTVIIAEPGKYNIKKFFNKDDVIYSIETVSEKNSKIDPLKVVINGDYKLGSTEVDNIIKKLDTKDNTGMGLIFIAESLNKSTVPGVTMYVFSILRQKKLLIPKRYPEMRKVLVSETIGLALSMR